MKILFIASESVPFCKTGGLADVIGALPKALRLLRHDVRVILPKYRTIRSQEFGLKEASERVSVPMGSGLEKADIRYARADRRVPYYFVHHEGYFGRAGLYRTPEGDYPDNAERFGFFCRAALETAKAMEFRPDIIHVHDWQTGLVPVFLKTAYAHDAFFQHTRSVFTIHNLAYQGTFPKNVMPLLHLPWSEFTPDKLEFYDQLSFLKAGLAYSDALTAVSPTYAREIQTAAFGVGMDGLLRHRTSVLKGILNGLDVEEWDPEKDPYLARPFGSGAWAERLENKKKLQERLKLDIRPDIPLVGVVARLDHQKGMDLLVEILPTLSERALQVIVLGQGDPAIHARLEELEKQHPDAFRVRSDFNEPLAHLIYGGSDLFLMPSRFEPCGLGQMIAMRYGAIPIVSDTGGLRDTVIPVGPSDGTGFRFENGNAAAFLGAIQEALHWWSDRSRWNDIQRRAMTQDFSWNHSAPQYAAIYRKALGREPLRKSRSSKAS